MIYSFTILLRTLPLPLKIGLHVPMDEMNTKLWINELSNSVQMRCLSIFLFFFVQFPSIHTQRIPLKPFTVQDLLDKKKNFSVSNSVTDCWMNNWILAIVLSIWLECKLSSEIVVVDVGDQNDFD